MHEATTVPDRVFDFPRGMGAVFGDSVGADAGWPLDCRIAILDLLSRFPSCSFRAIYHSLSDLPDFGS